MSRILLAILLLAVVASGQTFAERYAKIRQIKILESTRDQVRPLLSDYVTAEDNEYEQAYDRNDTDVTIWYSSGVCSETPDDRAYLHHWNTDEGTVVRIEIEPDKERVFVRDVGFDLSKMMKEQTYKGSREHLTYHDKVRGIAIETNEDRIERIIFYPGKREANRLCDQSAAKDFYSRESWFSKPLEKRYICELLNTPAYVDDVVLSAIEIAGTTSKTIDVSTVTVDAENDVLTYSYNISAGVIHGSGAKVVWDLSNAKPGEYTITVGVDDGAGIVGKTVTKTVTVR